MNHTRHRSLGMVACWIVLWAFHSTARADDWQLWTEAGWSQNLGNALVAGFRSQLRFERDMTYVSYYEVEPSLMFRYSPRYDFFVGYERDARFRPQDEAANIPNFGAIVNLPIKKLEITNRSRIDFILNEKAGAEDDIGFKNLFNIRHPWSIGSKELFPFAFDEFLLSTRMGEVAENKVGMGIEVPIAPHWGAQVYWMRQDLWSDNGESEWHPVLGVQNSGRILSMNHSRKHMLKRNILVIVTIVGFASLLLVGCSREDGNKSSPSNPVPAEPQKSKILYWTCSMHPQIHADKPGKCPICGMNLVPVESSENSPSGSTEIRLSGQGIQLAGVKVEKAERRNLSKDLLIFGTIGYNQNRHRDVVSLVEGRIEKQWVDFNQNEVKKGAPLVSLFSMEAIQLQEEYLKALREKWLSTFYERDLMESAVRLAAERLRRIGFSEEDIDQLRENKSIQKQVIIRSPITGSIVGNMVHVGEMAKKDESLYHIVPLDEMWFNGQVFEPDLGLLKLGQTIRITTKSYGSEEFTGKLTYIGVALDPVNRTVPVRFTVQNKERKLVPNLSASGQIEIPIGKEVLSVPNSAVLDLGTRHIVYVQGEPGSFIQHEVRVGYVTSHYTQILEGLNEGDDVVVSGAFLIDAQSQLRREGSAGGGQSHGSGSTMNPIEQAPEPVPSPATDQHHH